jgi:hypothetical protein
MKPNILIVLPVAVLTLLFSAERSHATLLYYEGFNYTSGSTVGTAANNGLNGGSAYNSSTGAATAWSTYWWDNSSGTDTTKKYTVASSGLSYGSLSTGGLALSQSTDTIGATRSLNSALSSGTYYVSFLYNVAANNSLTAAQYAGLQIGSAYVGLHTSTGTTRDLVVSGSYANSTTAVSTGINLNYGHTYLLVLKIDFSTTGTDTYSLWVDPTVSSEANAGSANAVNTSVDSSTINSVSLYSYSTTFGMTVDELRIGTSWADVTTGLAVPEPETYALFVGAMALLFGGVRRRMGRTGRI